MADTARSLMMFGCERKFIKHTSWSNSAFASLEEPFFKVFTATMTSPSGSFSSKPTARPVRDARNKDRNKENVRKGIRKKIVQSGIREGGLRQGGLGLIIRKISEDKICKYR